MIFNFTGSKLVVILKWCALALPIIAFAYSELAPIWSLPYGVEIYKSSLIIEAMLMALIGLDRTTYKEESLGEVMTDEEVSELNLEEFKTEDELLGEAEAIPESAYTENEIAEDGIPLSEDEIEVVDDTREEESASISIKDGKIIND